MPIENTFPVLDHGFVTLRNISGPERRSGAYFDADDRDIANVARISFDGLDKDRTKEQDMKLADYLMRNSHWSPFEMIEVWLEMKMPIFVARQYLRHRSAAINEVSGRYVELSEEWYIPAAEDVMLQSLDKKQGGRKVDMQSFEQRTTAQAFVKLLEADCQQSYARYKSAIDEGIAMEQARLFLHQNHYTHLVWKQDLRNMMNLLRLRDHSHAQMEAQCYARAIDFLIRKVLPDTMTLYDKYVKEGK